MYFDDLKEANVYGVQNISTDHGSNSLYKTLFDMFQKTIYILKQNSVVMEVKFPVYLETNVYYYP
jgi:hypothetical protein